MRIQWRCRVPSGRCVRPRHGQLPAPAHRRPADVTRRLALALTVATVLTAMTWRARPAAAQVPAPTPPDSLRDSVATPRDSVPAPPRDTAPMLVVQKQACAGQRITAVDIEREPPRIMGRDAPLWRRAFFRFVFQHRTTEPWVVRDYLRFEGGDECDEFALEESVRLLRAQPFIADALIRLEPDSAGGVRAVVETVDEIPLVIGGELQDNRISGILYGNSNLLGQGRYASVEWEQGFAFRDGLGARFTDYHVLNGPNVLDVQLRRSPLGHHYAGGLSRPFYTQLQRSAWTATYRTREGYAGFRRRGARTLSLPGQHDDWIVGGVYRLGRTGRGIFGGAVAFGDSFDPIGRGVIVTDTGLVADADTLLIARYDDFRSTHVAAVLGFSALSFQRVEGFDALAGPQDIGRGLQVATAVDPGLGSEQFYSGDVYAGAGTRRWFLGARTEIEGRRSGDEGWHDVVAGGRLAWYLKPAETRTIITSAEYGAGWSSSFPYQVTLADRRGGLRGYRRAVYAGGRRAVLRSEYRAVLGTLSKWAGVGAAGFVEGGKLWAGDVPFGVTTGAKASVGVSLLAAAPPQSRRLLRADVAFPLVRGGGAGWELRVSSTAVARTFWREPGDVGQLRAAPLASSIFNWP
jgi:hypothetical protein